MYLAKAPTKLTDHSDIASFSSLVACLEDGALDRDLTVALQRIVTHMSNTYREAGGRPSGKISLVIELGWVDGMVRTRHSFKCEPIAERTAGHFYPTPEGALTQNSPFVQESLLVPSKPDTRTNHE